MMVIPRAGNMGVVGSSGSFFEEKKFLKLLAGLTWKKGEAILLVCSFFGAAVCPIDRVSHERCQMGGTRYDIRRTTCFEAKNTTLAILGTYQIRSQMGSRRGFWVIPCAQEDHSFLRAVVPSSFCLSHVKRTARHSHSQSTALKRYAKTQTNKSQEQPIYLETL